MAWRFPPLRPPIAPRLCVEKALSCLWRQVVEHVHEGGTEGFLVHGDGLGAEPSGICAWFLNRDLMAIHDLAFAVYGDPGALGEGSPWRCCGA